MKSVTIKRADMSAQEQALMVCRADWDEVIITQGTWWDNDSNQLVCHFNKDGYWTGEVDSQVDNDAPLRVYCRKMLASCLSALIN